MCPVIWSFWLGLDACAYILWQSVAFDSCHPFTALLSQALELYIASTLPILYTNDCLCPLARADSRTYPFRNYLSCHIYWLDNQLHLTRASLHTVLRYYTMFFFIQYSYFSVWNSFHPALPQCGYFIYQDVLYWLAVILGVNAGHKEEPSFSHI